MNISKPVKIFVGFLTVFAVLFPFVIMPAFMMFFVFSSGFPFFDPQSASNSNDIKAILPFMMVFYPLMMCYSFVQLGLQIFYVIHEIKNKTLTDTFRILYAIGTFFLPYVAMPIYFFIYVWKEEVHNKDYQSKIKGAQTLKQNYNETNERQIESPKRSSTKKTVREAEKEKADSKKIVRSKK